MNNPFVINNKPKRINYNNDELVDINILCNIFIDDIDSKLYFNISKIGHRILFLIMNDIEEGDDLIDIDVKKYSKILNCSIQNVYKGINNLVENNFITKYIKSKYWINPHYIFKGDRNIKYNVK